MVINTLIFSIMRTNCYFITEEKKVLLIDPADEASFILEKIQRESLELVGMVATHGHFDHIMAVGEIQLTYPAIPLHIHTKDRFLIKRIDETAQHFLGYNPSIIEVQKTIPLVVGMCSIPPFSFRVIHTPGHTPGGCSLYFKEEKVVFTGDTLFKDGVGRYDFSYCNYDHLQNSLTALFSLPAGTVVHPGHGERTTIKDEARKHLP